MRNILTEKDSNSLDEIHHDIEKSAYEKHSSVNSDTVSTSSVHQSSISLPPSSDLDSESCQSIVDNTLQIENQCVDDSSDNETLPSDDNESTVSSEESTSCSDSESTNSETTVSENDSGDEQDIEHSPLSKKEHQAYSLLSCFI